MKRFGLLALVAALAGAGGCASSAKYVKKDTDSGIVAVPNDSESNKREARKLIEEHVGPSYEITDQKTVKTGRQTRSSLPDTNEALNPRRPGSPAYQSSTHATSMPEQTQYQISYVRKGDFVPNPKVSDINNAGLTGGLTPYVSPTGGTVQTQYLPSGSPPGALSSPFNRPMVAGAAGGADCDH